MKVEEAPEAFEESVMEEKPLESHEIESAIEEGELITKQAKVELEEELDISFDIAEKPTVLTKPTELASAEVVEHKEVVPSEEVSMELTVESAEVTETKVEEKVTVSGTKMEVAPVKPEVTEMEHVDEEEAPIGKGGLYELMMILEMFCLTWFVLGCN